MIKREEYPEKRKRVKWLKVIPKDEFRGELKGLISSHQAVTNAYKYSDIIEGNLSTLYIKNNRIFFTIKIDQEKEINAFELQRFLHGLTFFYKELCSELEIADNEDLFIKIKVQSKGGMFLRAGGIVAVVALATMMTLTDNPGVKVDLGKLGKYEGKGTGIWKSWSNVKDADEARKERSDEAAQKLRIEWIKFMDSRKKLKAKPINDSVTKEEDSISQH